jgi:hypothetical protein
VIHGSQFHEVLKDFDFLLRWLLMDDVAPVLISTKLRKTPFFLELSAVFENVGQVVLLSGSWC